MDVLDPIASQRRFLFRHTRFPYFQTHAYQDDGAATAERSPYLSRQQFQVACDAEQASFRGIDDDLEEPLQGTLTLADDAIYQIQLTPDGVTGTVIYNEFHCSNVGYAWCGSGGCGFHIIVDGVASQRLTGFRPISVTADSNTFVLIPIHGSGCITSEGMDGAGVNECYVVATWDPSAGTFRSKDGEITLPPA